MAVTKDMSRLTRNSTHSGQSRDEFFPKHHIRYIGVTDGVDMGKDDDLIAFRSVFNEICSKDIGKKVHYSYVIKAKKSKFAGCVALFGYMKSLEDKNFLIPDKILTCATYRKKADMMRERLDGAAKEQEDNPKRLSLVRQYADIKELDREILHLLIKEIVVHEDMSEGRRNTTVEIHFNFMKQGSRLTVKG